MINLISQYSEYFVVLIWVSIITFFVSLAAIPWFVVQIPEDYFDHNRRHKLSIESSKPRLGNLLSGLKNVVGFLLVVLGIIMLVLPGQGLLTILIGLLLMNFPGKYKLERKLVSMPKVLVSLNWIRAKAGKPPLAVS